MEFLYTYTRGAEEHAYKDEGCLIDNAKFGQVDGTPLTKYAYLRVTWTCSTLGFVQQ